MTHATQRKNLAAAIIALVGVVCVLIGTALSEGEFVCISKANLIAIGGAMGIVARAVGEIVGRERPDRDLKPPIGRKGG